MLSGKSAAVGTRPCTGGLVVVAGLGDESVPAALDDEAGAGSSGALATRGAWPWPLVTLLGFLAPGVP